MVHLKTEQSETAICPSCGTQGSLTINIFRKHAHIFWIPLFPFGKKGVSQCEHCNNILEMKEMPDSLKREFENLKNETKGPIWQFTGLGIIAILIVWGNYVNGEDKKTELEYLKSPQIGDVYEYKIETGSYSTLKVVGVKNDSIFVSPNEYEISKMSKMYKIDKSENYSNLSYGVSINKIKEMYDSGEIFDINR